MDQANVAELSANQNTKNVLRQYFGIRLKERVSSWQLLILTTLFFISMVVNSGAAVYTVLALTENINFAQN